MPLNSLQMILLTSFSLTLAACSRSGDWPNLSDKMPDPAQRERVIVQTDPSAQPREIPDALTSEQEALSLLEDITKSLSAARAEFERSMAAIEPTAEDARIRWMSAQVAVTRLSQTASRLNAILFSDFLNGAEVQTTARRLKDETDQIVVEARQTLAKSEPD